MSRVTAFNGRRVDAPDRPRARFPAGLADERHLIALWDGKSGDGPGGTADVVSRARRSGFSVQIINPTELKERSP